MVLRAGFLNVAVKLQEAADMAHSNVRSMLSDAVNDAHRGTGQWASYMDHTGDGESGDCIYNCGGDTYKAPYEISEIGGKKTANLDTENKVKVQPITEYHELADADDHYSAMEESFRAAKLYTAFPQYERFISKGERDKADENSFAGKGKSFPILKPGDVQAAVHAMGRAGSDNFGPAALKANIIRIAKAKGWTSELPKAWQGTESTESRRLASRETSVLKLTEATEWTQDLVLDESIASGVEREIKIIAPGKGSSAFYTESALKNSGPKVFRSGTQMFINHATRAEEAERPEGDWRKLVGALTSDAVYHEAHARGAGLYAKAKFVSSMAPEIIEKAPFTGVSIRANGRQALEAGRPVTREGLPVLGEFTECDSIDIVTKAGAGGMVLTESQRQGEDMTQEQIAQLREAGRMALHETARRAAIDAMADISLAESGKNEVIRRCLSNIPTKDGWLDEAAFREAVKAEAKAVGAFLATLMPQGVRGMGGAPVQLTEAEQKAERKALKRLTEAKNDIFAGILGDPVAAKFATEGRPF